MARIAGLLHLAAHLHDGYGKPIADSTMLAAIEIGEYFADTPPRNGKRGRPQAPRYLIHPQCGRG
ncbi:DUF3987 domain-containing protein [Streptomyces sp. PU-14G]|uniref:DUF3987 domain-containing protein n=1 Tax=Streptomyces sp. PU-14G TaxID=2800808 RepID=UPI0034DFA01F